MRKRHTVICSAVLVFVVFAILGLIIFNTPRKDDLSEYLNFDELTDEFVAEYFDSYYELATSGDKENILIVTSRTAPEMYGAVSMVEGPNNQYYLRYESAEARDAALESFHDDGVIAEENIELKLLSDGTFNSWGITMMGLDEVIWKINGGDEVDEVNVAVIDSGLATEVFHGAYPDKRYETYDAVTGSEDVVDAHGHGTHVAGTVAEGTPDNVGIVAINVMSEDEKIFMTDFIAALNYVITNNKADVINMSFGSESDVFSEKLALASANDAGIICVAAAGNEGENIKYYPASYNWVISVGAVDWQQDILYFSNYNDQVDFVAPGIFVYSLNNQGGTVRMSGTSMASPHVAASVAILKSLNKDIDLDGVIESLKKVAIDLGDEGRDDYYGYGFVDFSGANLCTSGVHCDEYGVFVDENLMLDYTFSDNTVVTDGVTLSLDIDDSYVLIGNDGEHYKEINKLDRDIERYVYNISDYDSLVLAYRGDVSMNGVVNARDSSLISYYLLSNDNPNHVELSELELVLADVNGNGFVNARDSSLINYSLLSENNEYFSALRWRGTE